MTRLTIQTDAGTEIQCARCKEFWPCDPEFFQFSAGKPHSWCKACYASDPKVIAKKQRDVAKLTVTRATRRFSNVPQERTSP